MKANIYGEGDPSVGIAGHAGSVDLNVDFDDDQEREDVRQMVAAMFADLWSEPAQVVFDDEEFGEWGAVQRKVAPATQDALK